MAQPKRDPNDRRFWPLALGGTGTGFSGKDRTHHKSRYSALRKRPRDRHKLEAMAKPSIDDIRHARTPEAVRMRARLILDMVLDRIEEQVGPDGDKAATMKELASLVQGLGRIGGVASTDVNVQVKTLPPEERDARLARLLGGAQVVEAIQLSTPSPPCQVAERPEAERTEG